MSDIQAPKPSRLLRAVAWGAILLASSLPDIAFSLLAGGVPAWLVYAKMGLLLGLSLAALAWRALRPLIALFVLLFVFFGLGELRPRIDFTWPALQALFGGTAFDARMQAEQSGKLVLSLLMIAALLALGFRRKDFFLALGNLRARIRPVVLLGFPEPDPLPRFGLKWGLYIAAALGLVQYFGMRPDGALLARLLPMLPAILFYAALNAFNEEIFYRAPILAALEPVLGGRTALWIAAYFFGIGHFFGVPGGIPGALASIFMGWILGKGMLETRGMFWSWWIHFLSDVVIFAFLGLGLIGGG